MEMNCIDFVRGQLIVWIPGIIMAYFFIQWLWRGGK